MLYLHSIASTCPWPVQGYASPIFRKGTEYFCALRCILESFEASPLYTDIKHQILYIITKMLNPTIDSRTMNKNWKRFLC